MTICILLQNERKSGSCVRLFFMNIVLCYLSRLNHFCFGKMQLVLSLAFNVEGGRQADRHTERHSRDEIESRQRALLWFINSSRSPPLRISWYSKGTANSNIVSRVHLCTVFSTKVYILFLLL